jgi:ribosomal protein S18 acetylase RimI-like enzyme
VTVAALDRALWERILRADEVNLAYFAERAELPGVAVFTAERPDAPEFDLAVIYRVSPAEAEAVLRRIVRLYRDRGRTPRVRLSPISAPADWPERLLRAGFAETDERYVVNLVPETARFVANPTVTIRRAVTPEDADAFSAVQVAGFDVPAAHRAWDRELARRHLAIGRRVFYLASLDGRTVGAAAGEHLAGGVTALSGLTTLPEARGRGVATSLLARRVEDAREAGNTVIFSTALAGGYAAGLYQRLGLVPLFAVRTFAQQG